MKKTIIIFLTILVLIPIILASSANNVKVELFVMAECPYAAQAEKGIIPVFELLGNKIDSKIRFVYYFMHGDSEEQETYVQVCIREEQSEKYLDYLACFLEDGNSDRCLTEASIDKSVLDTCIQNNAKEYYAEDSELSQEYEVRGSPTLVINEEIKNSERSPAAYLDTICDNFDDKPEECYEELSDKTPSPGFGYNSNEGEQSDDEEESNSDGEENENNQSSSGNSANATQSGCFNGCLYQESCIPFGYRLKNEQSESVYCDISHELKIQKLDDDSCDNNFECLSGDCINGLCVDLQKGLAETTGRVVSLESKVEESNTLLQKIINFLKKLFRFK